ncbi:MAG: M55 family metallopeptidase [Spirochaetota bacterium]
MQTCLVHLFVCATTFLVPILPAAAGSPETPNKRLRVFISADMEGVAGVVNGAQLAPGEFEYEKFRRLMTAEVNACIEGALAAGATAVTVADSHGNGLSLLPEELNPRARLVRSWPRPLAMVEGIDQGYDAVILLGYHASIGTPGAVRAHTMSSKRIYGMRLNGVHTSEALLSAAVAGHYGVPVVLVSGDDRTIEEARKTISDKITGVVVKRAIGYHSADSLSPQQARLAIQNGTREALGNLARFKPFTVARPVKLEIAFKNMLNAEVLSLLPIIERVDGSTIRFTGKDMPEVMKFIEFVGQYSTTD